MMTNRKMNPVKRIAFAASANNRKSLIEWSYYNQDVLKNHELIATGPMAGILEGTIGVPVTRLAEGLASANHQLANIITEQKIDILVFFWDPAQPLQQDNDLLYLHDMAIANNIIIAGNLATADFVLSSVLMEKSHTVPVFPEALRQHTPVSYFNMRDTRQAVLKVNTIN